MKIFYGYDRKEEEFIPLAIEQYNKLAKTNVGKFSRNKNRLPILEDAYISTATVDNLVVVAISFETVGIAVESKKAKVPKKFKKTLQEFVDYNAFLRWTGKGILMSVTYNTFPEDKLRRFEIDDYVGSAYSMDGSVSLIEIK